MKTKMPLHEAAVLAREIMGLLAPFCERIEIAGSIRRRKAEVGDIELVAISQTMVSTDLFGNERGTVTVLDHQVSRLVRKKGWRFIQNGQKYKQIDLGSCCLDLFITDRDQWGVIFLLRTGSAEFSHWFVTRRSEGGGLPSHMRIQDGRLWIGGQVADTPEESDVFEKTGICWVSPNERERP